MKVWLLVVGCWLLVLTSPLGVFAQEYGLLAGGRIIDSDYLQTGNIVQVDGEVRGDAFLAGGLVTINGKIDGDLFVAGGKVNINGEVGNSVRVLGGDVVVNGPVGKNVLLLCGNCSVTRFATMGGSLIAAGGNLELSAAKIGRGFRFFGSRLFLNSGITNEAFVVADREFVLGPRASVSGNLKYTGNNEAILEPGATVGGNIAYEKTAKDETYPRFFGAKTVLQFYQKIKPLTETLSFVVMALVGFTLLGLFPRWFEKVVLAIENRPYASLGWGVISAVAIPVAAALFAITVVGIPVALILLLVAYLVWLAAQYLTAFYIGRKILLPKYGERRGWALVVGLTIIFLLGLVPVLGNLVKMVLVLFSLGGAVLAYKQPVIIEQRRLPFEYPPKTPRSRGRARR